MLSKLHYRPKGGAARGPDGARDSSLAFEGSEGSLAHPAAMFNTVLNASDCVHLTAPVKRVGNSLAIFIPAEKAREGHLREGDMVEAEVGPSLPSPLGLCSRFPYEPFDRRREGMWRDRV